jgi:hypothetical protein
MVASEGEREHTSRIRRDFDRGCGAESLCDQSAPRKRHLLGRRRDRQTIGRGKGGRRGKILGISKCVIESPLTFDPASLSKNRNQIVTVLLVLSSLQVTMRESESNDTGCAMNRVVSGDGVGE